MVNQIMEVTMIFLLTYPQIFSIHSTGFPGECVILVNKDM